MGRVSKMKKITVLYSLISCIIILYGCNTITGKENHILEYKIPILSIQSLEMSSKMGELGQSTPENEKTIICRVISITQDGELILAEIGGNSSDLYCQTTEGVSIVWPRDSEENSIESGMTIQIDYDGLVLETYPAQLANTSRITVLQGKDNLCELYLHVLCDLWEKDENLNQNIIHLGVDLSNTRLSVSEQAGVAWAFGEHYGFSPLMGTFEELRKQGYFTDNEWKDGCLFSIEEKDLERSSQNTIIFDAKKWRSGDGAYYFTDCVAEKDPQKGWENYMIGSEMIS